MISMHELLRQNGGKIVIQVGAPHIEPPPLPGSPADVPGIMRRFVNFGGSLAAHIKSGALRATDEQVAARWDVCRSNKCGLFKEKGQGNGQCLHPSCGCNLKSVGNESSVVPNKLRWADQKCPVGLWGALPAPPAQPPEQEPKA